MPSFYPSANMNMPIPVVGVDTGPNWAININSSLTLVDSHDHSSGKGVQITPAGILINATLAINSQDITLIRSARFYPQLTVSNPADVGCLYVIGDDLFYNDVSGTQIQITDNGGVAGTPGSIANLLSPASASYVSANDTFVWQSGVNQAANLDFRSAILRNSVASSFGMTINPPSGMLSNFAITFPTLPVSTSYLTMNTSGNIIHANPPIIKSQVFLSNGIWNCPANVTTAIVYGHGGGGGGGGGNGTTGGGGGGGAVMYSKPIDVTPGGAYTITVGAGGTGGVGAANGADGFPSFFGGIIRFNGAYGGKVGGTGAAGSIISVAGGAGSTGTGANGLEGFEFIGGFGGTSGGGGGGGGGASGFGANGGSNTGVGVSASGNSGAGGGGAGKSGANGGNGGSGVVIVCWVE